MATTTKNLLQLCTQALSELGQTLPTALVGSNDSFSRQVLALAQREGRTFASLANQWGGWSVMRKQNTFSASFANVTGNTTEGSPIITGISSTTDIEVGMLVTGNGVQSDTYVSTVDSPTQVTCTLNATSTTTGISLAFAVDNWALPTDYQFLQVKTQWERGQRWEILGAISPQQWQYLKSGYIAPFPRKYYRIMNNRFYLFPAPNSAELLVYEYISDCWCQSAAATPVPQSYWAADTDTYLLDPDCFVLGVKWRYLRAKGLSYDEEFRDYKNACDRALSRDGGGTDLYLGNNAGFIRFIDATNMPDTIPV